MVDRRYQPLQPNQNGWLWSEALGVWLGTWEGTVDREPPSTTCHWLRFYDRQGNLVPLPEELVQQQLDSTQQQLDSAQQQLDQERHQAERLAARLRELGEDPDAL